MSIWKNIKDRIVAFVIGVVMTVIGAILLYYDFFGRHEVYTDNLSYSIPIFFTGIACILIAFDKKKKKEDLPVEKDDPALKK